MRNKMLSLVLVAGITPGLVTAHGYGWNDGWFGQMGFMGGGFMMFFWVLLLLVVVTAVFKWIGREKNGSDITSSARSVLAERYAKGEISQEEFKARKKDLS